MFYDDDAILFDDPEHSEAEDRFIIVGIAGQKGICLVSHCYQENDEIIRIISARKATKAEKKIYQESSEQEVLQHERRI